MSEELKFPIAAHHRIIVNAGEKDVRATAAQLRLVPGLKMVL